MDKNHKALGDIFADIIADLDTDDPQVLGRACAELFDTVEYEDHYPYSAVVCKLVI